MRWLWLLMAGCPWVGGEGYEANVADVDGDGEWAVRFGGQDCDDEDPTVVDCDRDNDGFVDFRHGGQDCDDEDPTVHPEAPELCDDGIDNDCDQRIDGDDEVDEAFLLPFHADADGDGFGDAATTLACSPPAGFVTDGTDCDDSRADTNPNALERCDPLDHDCDGDPHANAADAPLWYQDLDQDGFAGAFAQVACERPDPALVDDSAGIDCDDDDAGLGLCDADGDGQDATAAGGPDCDDTRVDTYQGAPELCDDRDNDCDGQVDEDLSYVDTWPDLDGDGAGNALLHAEPSCAGVPAGRAANADDCDDDDDDVFIGAIERCDGADNDCDGLVDGDDDSLDPESLLTWYRDADADGYGDDAVQVAACAAPAGHVATAGDCNDDSADINPAPDTLEICNTLDDDCDGQVDEGAVDAPQYYADGDGDGHGSLSVPIRACVAGPGIAATSDDCNDADATVYPGAPEVCGDSVRQDCRLDVDLHDCDADGAVGLAQGGTDCDDTDATVGPDATEVCDGADNDCDGAVDDADDDVDLNTAQDWFTDLDGDGFGTGSAVFACTPPPQTSNTGGDCDDDDDAIRPDATEVCDGEDNDCDGAVDMDDPSISQIPDWYRDLDGDGYGAGNALSPARCVPPTGWVANADDCDDILPSINPEGSEICNDRDDDCDGLVDIGASDAPTFFLDADGDGFGSAATPIDACEADPTVGIVADATDCNDGDGTVYPGAIEICYDAVRQDCSTAALDDCDGDGESAVSQGGTDCADDDPDVNTAAVEVCDGEDNDCDGLLDDADNDVDAGSAVTWYLDHDGDGHGDPAMPLSSCARPTGYVLADDDCDDASAEVYPGAPERCNGTDDDCDGTDDDDPVDATTWYPDGDGDGFGIPTGSVEACDPPAATGWSSLSTDCNDALAGTHPGADEVCDGADNDCDLVVDDFPIDGATYYADADGDGFGAPSQPTIVCNAAPGLVTNANDCNDADSTVHPGAPEICYDSVRQDCSTADLNDCDADGVVDLGHGGTDCDDTRPSVLPGAQEICDGLDNDCDGLLDDADPEVDLSSATDWYPDGDGDGYGVESGSQNACNQPVGFVLLAGDCDDTDHAVNPAAAEVCGNGDDDCDGAADDLDPEGPSDPPTWYRDNDGDGTGDPFVALVQCAMPAGTWSLQGTDCNDTNPHVNPLAIEVCNGGVDDDCDTLVDDLDPGISGQTTWYRDNDGDGTSVLVGGVVACAPPTGFIAPSAQADCNDASASVYPGADERCNGGIDDDCDGLADSLDPSVVDTVVWYDDDDGDGYGDPLDSTTSCTQPPGHRATAGDCNDASSGVNPAAPELCDGVDNDCDGGADDLDPDAPLNPPTWLEDFDDDGFGDASDPRTQCLAPGPTWKLVAGGDCNDSRADIYPGADEVCDTEDNDCDGLTDDLDPGVIDRRDWYLDHDGDGRAAFSATPLRQCFAPLEHAENLPLTDCDDGDPLAYLGAPEIHYNGVDNDCLGPAGEYDQDGDSVLHPSGGGTDCNDTDPTISPLQAEVFYNGVDQDCDGLSDYDQDRDGHDFPSDCLDDPAGDVARVLAGQPTAAQVFLGANETWYDGIDQDCDGNDDYDQDGDGYAVIVPSSWPFPYTGTLEATDCDDEDALVKPQDTTIGGDQPDLVQQAFDRTCQGTVTITGDPTDVRWTIAGRSLTLQGFLQDVVGTGGTLLTVEAADHPQFPGERLDSDVVLREVLLTEGNSAGNGGCLRVRSGQTVTMVDSALSSCVAVNGAGAYLESGATLSATGESIQDNFATGLGAAIYAELGAHLSLEELRVSDNQGDLPGIVAHDVGSLLIRGVRFQDNVGESNASGSGFAGWDLDVSTGDGPILIQDVYVEQPPVPDQGAGSTQQPVFSIESLDAQAVVDGATMRLRNGAIRSSGNLRVQNSAFVWHPDRDINSGFLITHEAGELEVDHSVFHREDRGNGRGIRVDFASFTLTDSVFTNLGSDLLDINCDLGPFDITILDNGFETDGFGNLPYPTFFGCYPERVEGIDLSGSFDDETPTEQSAAASTYGPCSEADRNCLITLDDHFQTFHELMPLSNWNFRPAQGSQLEDGARTGVDLGPFGQDGTWNDDVAPADGIPDAWAAQYGVSGTTTDSDNDGLDNLTEYLTGTLPDETNTDGDSSPFDGTDPDPLDPTVF